MKYLPFLLFLALFSCDQEDFQLSPSETALTEVVALPTLPSATNLDPSILASDWWRQRSSVSQRLVRQELSATRTPITYGKLEAQFRLAVDKASPSSCGGFPVPNPAGDVILNSQADVDAFGAMKCKEITGLLEVIDTLGPDPIVDLSPLNKLKSVGSSLTINADGLTDLDGLNKLKTIGLLGPFGFIGVNGANLTDISALSNLKTVTGSINIIDCDALTSVTSAFNKLKVIAPGQTPDSVFSIFTLNISNNDILTDLSAFSGLTTMDLLFIQTNGALTDLDDLSGLTTIVDGIRIFENSALQNVDELSNITSINDNLFVFDNPVLSTCCGFYGLLCANPPACTSNNVGGNVIIFNNGPGCEEADIVAGGSCP